MTAVTAMAAMHEHVKQRAGEQQQKGKGAERVRPVLREKEKRGDQQEGDRGQASLRSPESTRSCLGLLFWFGAGRGIGYAVCVWVHGLNSL